MIEMKLCKKLLVVFQLVALTTAHAQTPPPTPYSDGGGQNITVNGQSFPRNVVFLFLPATLPLASLRITSLYGYRKNPFTGQGEEFHPGVDFGQPMGTPVFSTAAGIITFVGSRGDYGTMIEITHALGFKTRYSHLSSTAVTVGTTVNRNSRIGEVGTTGRSTGPHLYYEIWKDGVRVDPIVFILTAYQLYHHLN